MFAQHLGGRGQISILDPTVHENICGKFGQAFGRFHKKFRCCVGVE